MSIPSDQTICVCVCKSIISINTIAPCKISSPEHVLLLPLPNSTSGLKFIRVFKKFLQFIVSLIRPLAPCFALMTSCKALSLRLPKHSLRVNGHDATWFINISTARLKALFLFKKLLIKLILNIFLDF